MSLKKGALSFVVPAMVGVFLLFTATAYAQEDGAKRSELERQLEQLEQEASQLDSNLQKTQGETRTLANETATLNTEIKRRELEIKRLTLVIKKTALEVQNKEAGIGVLSRKIDKSRKALAAGLFLVYVYDQDNTLTVLLKNGNLSDFFTSVNNLQKVESRLQGALGEFRDDRTELEEEKNELEEFQEDQQDLKALQDVERRFLAQKKKEKDELLRLTKGKEALFQQLLQSKKRDIATLKTQLFYIEKTGITAEDAVRMATLAANRAGIRPAFLLALLEVETGKQFEDGVISVGTNVGTGNWERDLYNCYLRLGKRTQAENEKKAFFTITGKLNLDPNKMPVSRKPNYGCGGAMGPAQFLPTTWLRFEDKVAELTGHNPPNPWNPEDAFTASAVFLAQSGAASKTQAGEIRAAKTYISGRSTCTSYICRVYSNRIISLARDIDRIL
ncbi:MAG: lytic murein transglycosylase [Candidatus Sungbacteria bacterium]|nr:lytic murein transglycosylase [Candidatus Sungbacteria bacterium]